MDLLKKFAGTNSFPSWSANGKYLSCISLRDPTGFGKVLVTLSPDSGQIIREFRPKMAFIGNAVSAPDGTAFAVLGTDLKGRHGIFRVDPRTGEAAPLSLDQVPQGANRPIQNGNPEWSPDGKSLFYTKRSPVSKDAWTYALVKLDLTSRDETEILGAADPIPSSIRVSPDRRWIAIPSTDAASKSAVVRLIPVQGGAPREILRTQQPNQFTVLGWTPDGRSVIVRKVVASKPGPASPDPQIEIWRVPIDGDPAQKLAIDVKSLPPAGPWSLSPDGRFIAISYRGPSIAEVSVLENFLPSPENKK